MRRPRRAVPPETIGVYRMPSHHPLFSDLRAEHDARLRRNLSPARYTLHRARRWVSRRVTGGRWRWQRGVGRAVRLLQHGCRHDSSALIETAAGPWLELCDFCGTITVDDDDDGALREAAQQVRDWNDTIE